MMTFHTWTILMPVLCLFFLKSPMKLMSLMAFNSVVVFSLIWVQSSSSWLPSIFFLMFMGGIVILFMMISTILPNEKSGKMKLMLILITVLVMSLQWIKPILFHNFMSFKWLSQVFSNTYMMCMMILAYFLIFLGVLSSNCTTLSSNMCL